MAGSFFLWRMGHVHIFISMTQDQQFRRWAKAEAAAAIQEAEDAETKDATKKAKFRNKKEKQGWYSVGFTGPAAAVEHVKSAWKEFKSQHAHLWD